MREKILRIAYDKGLYAQGTPDSWDEEALYQFGQHLIDMCLDAVEQMNTLKGATNYDKDMIESTMHHCVQAIESKFE